MSRTTPSLVSSVIEVDATIDLSPFIEVANELVTECCTLNPDGTAMANPYTDTRLQMIETWLAAHFYAVRDPRPQLEAVGPIRIGYQKVIDQGFAGTQYGQAALNLDTKGGLAAKNNKIKFMRDLPVGIMALGRSHPAHHPPHVELLP